MVLAALLIGRAVSKGRALNLPGDLSDAFLAITQGDGKTFSAVVARTGDEASATTSDTFRSADPVSGVVQGVGAEVARLYTNGLTAAAESLGAAAKGYRWASAGPDYYDCSGLMYRALQKVGYTGPRFTTSTLLSQKGMMRTLNPTANDMVLWLPGQGGVTGHVGVMSGDDLFYSARSIKSGIGNSKVSTFRKANPTYVRFVKP